MLFSKLSPKTDFLSDLNRYQLGRDSGGHNFLTVNSTQNYFLTVRMLSFFLDIRDKSAVFNILRQNEAIWIQEMDGEGGNKETIRKCRE